MGRLARIGIWENSVFIGVIIYSMGIGIHNGNFLNIHRTEVSELCRVAIRSHQYPVSKYLAISLRMIKGLCPKLRAIISFADTEQDHHGGIYQATNWYYVGKSNKTYSADGRHSRQFNNNPKKALKLWGPNTKIVEHPGKHKYVYILDSDLVPKIKKMIKPYPKRATSKDSVVLGDHPREGGASPTVALQTNDVLV